MHDVKQYLKDGDRSEWIPTGLMVADQLTKHLPWPGPLADMMSGRVQWRETPDEAAERPRGPERARRKKLECTEDLDAAIDATTDDRRDVTDD